MRTIDFYWILSQVWETGLAVLARAVHCLTLPLSHVCLSWGQDQTWEECRTPPVFNRSTAHNPTWLCHRV